jgi:protein CpxP
MKKDTFYAVVIILLLLLNLGTLGYLWVGDRRGSFPPPHHGPGGGGPAPLIIERLGLDDAQQRQFDVIRHEHHEQVMKLQDERRDLYEDYYSLLKHVPIDTVAADSMNRMIMDNQSRLNQVTFDHFMKLRNICKPEQVERYNGFIMELSRILSGPPPGRGPHP